MLCIYEIKNCSVADQSIRKHIMLQYRSGIILIIQSYSGNLRPLNFYNIEIVIVTKNIKHYN